MTSIDDSFDRAEAMVNDPNTQIDLNGLDPTHRAWVLEDRPDYSPDNI